MAKKKPGVQFSSYETRQQSLVDEALRDAISMTEALIRRRKASHPAAMYSQKDKFDKEDRPKLLMLCQHYRIVESPNMYYELSLELARELFPEPKKPGRRSKWTALIKGVLVVEVERLVRPDDPSHGVEWACKQLAKREPWQSFLEVKEGVTFGPDPAEALRQVYYGYRGDKWADVTRCAFRVYEQKDAIAEWEEERVSKFVRKPDPK